jgi:quercetin dioxygenase-like cupin family protein
MQSQSLTDLAQDQLAAARSGTSGRAARTVFGGHDRDLRQTLIALLEGHALGEHEAPGEATLQVLIGAVRVTAGEDTWTGGAGDLLAIPQHRHDLHADTDAAVLLTVATRA